MIQHVYIAGAITGNPNYLADFSNAASDLRARGIMVTNPCELDLPEEAAQALSDPYGEKYEELLARDLRIIEGDEIDAVVVLPGWSASKGANREVAKARELGKPVLSYPDLKPLWSEKVTEVRITDSETGGQKGRKPQRFELVPMQAVARIAEVYAFGASKYADHNWRKGYAWSLSYGAMMRHLAAFWEGEDSDPESGLSHLAHAGFHILALIHYADHFPAKDDRPTTRPE